MFPSTIDRNVGLLIRGKNVAERGQVLAEPGSIINASRFKARVYLLTSEEGGRLAPMHSGDKPQFFFRTLDVPGTVTLDGDSLAMPGSDPVMIVDLLVPIALEAGLKFAIRENGRTVGAGSVIEIMDSHFA